jgi:hypothetical protein
VRHTVRALAACAALAGAAFGAHAADTLAGSTANSHPIGGDTPNILAIR